MSYISESRFRDVCMSIPLICVDLIVKSHERYLLIRREQPPLQGVFWLPGGRILHGEVFEETIARIAKREVGLDLNSVVLKSKPELIGVSNMCYSESRFGLHSFHTPAFIFSVNIEDDFEVSLDDTSSEYCWSAILPSQLVMTKVQRVEE